MPEQGLSHREMGQQVQPWSQRLQPGHPPGTLDPRQRASPVIGEEAGCFLGCGSQEEVSLWAEEEEEGIMLRAGTG